MTKQHVCDALIGEDNRTACNKPATESVFINDELLGSGYIWFCPQHRYNHEWVRPTFQDGPVVPGSVTIIEPGERIQ